MSSSWPRPGLNNVGEYQLAGVPFVVEDASTARTITLQRVSRAITFISDATGASVHFFDVDASGVAVNTEIALPAGAVRFEVRCSKFYITGGATVGAVVELTGIEPQQLPLPLRTLGTVA
jgi:hypothetical protein